MATILLVHGGWHGGWCWRWVAPALRRAGHQVLAPTLSGLADRAHLSGPLGDALDLDTHVRDVVDLLHYEDLTGVVAVGHSYGGMVLTGLADRSPDRLAHLVYLDAFLPEDGQALFDLVRPERREALALAGEQGGGLVPPPGPAMLGVTDPDRADWLAARLTPQPLATFTQPLRLEGGDPGGSAPLARTYVHCTQGPMTGSFAPVLARLQGAPGWRTHQLATGHDAMVTEPGAVADLIAAVAGAVDSDTGVGAGRSGGHR